MKHTHCATSVREPWNKGKLVGQKAPFKLKEIWRRRLELTPARQMHAPQDARDAGCGESQLTAM